MENTLSLDINKELYGKHILVTGVTKCIDQLLIVCLVRVRQ